MRPANCLQSSLLRAPHYAGALLLLCIALGLTACRDDDGSATTTPDWSEPETENSAAPDPPVPSPSSDPPSAPEPAVPPTAEAAAPGSTLRFLSYNLKNYLTMPRYVDGERQERRKPEKEIMALVEIVVSARPDVVGICEIGTPEDLAELQNLLEEAGLPLPYREHAGGADQTRHLALLSRFPLAATHSQGAGGSLTYKSVDLDNRPKEFAMQRGILDATVQAGDRQVRFLGVHLKSKREIPDGHQDLMRRHEAYLLRQHADRILKETPDSLLCVYGDFNDSRRSSPVRSIQGPYNTSRFLDALPHKDSRGEVWTHYWDYEHIYSRFDYVLASPALRPFFDAKGSRVIDDPRWSVASDHRPLLTVFRWEAEAPSTGEEQPGTE